jgi:hypothetical protein
MIWELGQNEIIITVLILALLFLVLLIWNFVLHFRFNRLVKGSNKKTIEDSIVNIYKYIENANVESKKINDAISILQKQVHKSPRGFGIVNFKAFDGVKSGGSNSFAVAFVNDEGNGIVLSTFHARDRVNVFSKELKGFKSEVMLTEEENGALVKAKKSLSLS